MNQADMSRYITRNPEILGGKPIIRGTRIPVYLIVGFVEAGQSPEQIVDDYPNLTLEDVQAALVFWRSEQERETRPPFRNE